MIKDSPTNVNLQLWIVALGFFMQSLDTTILNTALPSMALSLNESPLQMQSVIVSYILTVAIGLPASGWLADRIGVKRVFLSAIVLFTLGSLLCAQSESLSELIRARVIQGIGGAMMVPVGRLTVMKIVPRAQYMAAMTFVTLPGQVGPLMGPALGGFLVEYASWHWIFLINLPVGIIGIVLTLFFMPNYKMPPRRFDIIGFVLLAVGMASITLSLDGHSGMGLAPLTVILLCACGICALGLYWLHARRSSSPLFDLKMFKIPTFSLGLSGSMLARIGGGMLPFMTPLFLQIGLGFSPFHAGLMMIPMIIGSMSIKRLVVQIVNRFGYRVVLTGSTLLLPVLIVAIPILGMLDLYPGIPFILFLLGMTNAVRFSTMNTLTLKDLPDEFASGGNSLLSMVMQLSMSLGVSTAGILLGLFSQQHVSTGSSEIQTAFLYTYFCVGLVMLIPTFIFARVPKDDAQNILLNKRN
ncbi:multidrug transporter subunit MdtD [Budvicia aquatica]|uniref:Putative multidrug resistance protein MdtD n=1 Tax=Budvicia aquatica TaxID=82979 RepID=A0A2C6DHV2_9GAMM|nr:multidrug transporter subunit MdtD [Budvicia aquatica]PHI30786.1 multidrug transporter subunit MdtD [Budvicia aquatica]